MLSGLIRTVLVIVIVVVVLVGIGAFFLGYRTGGHPAHQPAVIGTSGRDAASAAREKGAEIGARISEAAGRAGDALADGALTAKIKSKPALDEKDSRNKPPHPRRGFWIQPPSPAARALPRVPIKGHTSPATSAPQFETHYTQEPRSRMRLWGTPLPIAAICSAIRQVGVVLRQEALSSDATGV